MEGVEKIHVGDLQVSIDFIPQIVEFDTILISDSKAHKKRILHDRKERVAESGIQENCKNL